MGVLWMVCGAKDIEFGLLIDMFWGVWVNLSSLKNHLSTSFYSFLPLGRWASLRGKCGCSHQFHALESW